MANWLCDLVFIVFGCKVQAIFCHILCFMPLKAVGAVPKTLEI